MPPETTLETEEPEMRPFSPEETTETFAVSYEIKPAPMPTGTYRNITGNLALSYGLIAGGV